MTAAEFVEEFGRVAPTYHFPKTWVGKGRLRGRNGGEQCPITAVAHSRGYTYGTGDWSKAASAIGLDPRDAQEIVTAADHPTPDAPAVVAIRKVLERN